MQGPDPTIGAAKATPYVPTIGAAKATPYAPTIGAAKATPCVPTIGAAEATPYVPTIGAAKATPYVQLDCLRREDEIDRKRHHAGERAGIVDLQAVLAGIDGEFQL